MSRLALAKLKDGPDAGTEAWAIVADDYFSLRGYLLPDEDGQIYILARVKRYPDGMIMTSGAKKEQYLFLEDFDLDAPISIGPEW